MKFFIVLGILVLAGAWLGLSYYSQQKAKEIPEVSVAQYLVETNTRVYYAKEAYGFSPDITMKDYYEWDDGRWVYRPITIHFNKNTGEVIVTDRRIGK